LPSIHDYILPEYNQPQGYGASRVALSQIQAAIASSKEQPAWCHNIHFLGNTLALVTAIIGLLLAAYMCVQTARRNARERHGRQIEDFVEFWDSLTTATGIADAGLHANHLTSSQNGLYSTTAESLHP
jgi:hypothetical protein